MINLKYIRFFNKKGLNITSDFVDNVYNINLYVGKVSCGMFETEKIIILEEVLREIENIDKLYESSGSVNNIFVDTFDIKVLKYIYSYGSMKKSDLMKLLKNIGRGYETIEEEYERFVTRNEKFLNFIYDRGETYIFLSSVGKEYLSDYEAKKSHKYNAVVDYVRPIDIYNEETDVSFIYYRWKNNDNDRRFFVYAIDVRNKEKVSINKDVNICLSGENEYYSVIPLYNEILDYRYNSTIFELFNSIYNLYNYNDFSYEYPNISRYIVFDVVNNNYEIVSYFEDMVSSFRKIINRNSNIFLNRQPPFFINIAFYSNEEGIYDRTLEMFYVYGKKEVKDGNIIFKDLNFIKFANINFFVEFVGKDERLEGILSNFGWNIDPKYTYVFGNEDVEDDSINYIKYNEKNKQLIILGPEIFNYLGSYKSFFNVLKWLEYENIKVYEYFYKLDSNNNIISESTVEIFQRYNDIISGKNKLLSSKILSNEMSIQDALYGHISKDYIKSARYGLVVPITKYVGDDQDGNPIYEYIYVDNIDEIFVKLYGLKKLLEEKFLPHHVRIINISVEGVYLLLLKTLIWSNKNDFKILNLNDIPNINIEQNGKYVKNYLYEIAKIKNLLDIDDNLYYYTKVDEVRDRPLYFYMYNKCINDKYSNIIDYKDIKFYVTYEENYVPSDYSYYLNIENGYLYKKKDNKWIFLIDTKNYYLGKLKLFDIIKNIETFQDLLDIFSFSFKKGPGETRVSVNDKFRKFFGEFVTISYKPFEHNLFDLNFKIKDLKYFKISDLDNRISLYKVKNISDNSNYFVRWEIYDDNEDYYLVKEGYLEDLRSFILFLPLGSYNVKCILIDVNNVPSISLEKNIINILPSVGEIYLLTQYSDKDISIVKNLKYDNVSIKDIKSSVYGGSYLLDALSIKVKDLNKLLVKYLNFGNLNNIYYYKDFIIYDEIDEIDFINKRLYLKSDEFYYSFNELGNKWMNKNVILENLDYKYPYNDLFKFSKLNHKKHNEYYVNINNLNILNINKFNISLLEKYDIIECFNLYNIKLQNIKREINGLYLFLDLDINIFNNIVKKGNGILIVNQDNKNYLFAFSVKYVDFIHNIIKVFIDESVYKFDLKNINNVYYKYDEVYLRVIDINNSDIRFLDIRNEVDINKNYEFFVVNPFNYKYLITIKEVDIDENNRTVILFDSYCNIEFLSLKHKFLYIDNMSIDYVKLWSSYNLNLYRIKRSEFKVRDLKSLGFEDILYTYPMYLYWRIKVDKPNKIITLGKYKLFLNIEEMEYGETIFDYYLRKLRSADYPFNMYKYYLKGTSIIGISKKYGSKYLYDKSMYGDMRFSDWLDEDELYNQFPLWYPYYKEKMDIEKNNLDKNIYYIDGAFRLKNLFLTNKNVVLPRNVYVFMVYSNDYIDDDAIEYSWILTDELKGKIVSKSLNNYLGFRFVDTGLYSVSLVVKYFNYEYKIIRKGFIYIK